jgi:hypothetical protein
MTAPPLGAGFIQILLMYRVPLLDLLPEVPSDALKVLV